jgi:hypothetical protein
MLPSSAVAVSGSYVVKCGRTGSPELRILSFTGDYHLEWMGKRGKKGSIDLRLLSDIRIGQQTPLFRDLPADDLVDVSFSLILADRTLDLVTASRVERRQWIDALLDVSKIILPESSYSLVADSVKCQLQGMPDQTKWKPAQLRAKFVELTNPAVRQKMLKLKAAANLVIGTQRLAGHFDDQKHESNEDAELDDAHGISLVPDAGLASASKNLDVLTAISTRLNAHLESSPKCKFQADILMSFDTILGDFLSISLPVQAHVPLALFLHLLSKAVTLAPQNCDVVLYSGILPKLFSVIDLDIPDTLRCDIMSLLGSLAFWSESCQYAMPHQNFTSLMKFLHSSHEGFLCLEAVRLFGLVSRNFPEFQTFCRESGALMLLLNFCSSSNPRLKSVVAAAVNRVCSGNTENLKLLLESGALDHLTGTPAAS